MSTSKISIKGYQPRRQGESYCSPVCGFGAPVCTVQRYRNVRAAVKRLLDDLGEGWVGQLSHNTGWHGSVGSPCRRVWLSIDFDLARDSTSRTINGYTAFLGAPRNEGGSGKWAEYGDTPREAIERVVEAAMADLGLIRSITDGLAAPKTRKLKK